ncbi:MAG: hypothetical protein ABI847_15735, partial [Anaerolineales bacterium]
GPVVETMLIYIGAFLVSTNPIATAVATEVLLVSQQSAFYFTIPLSNGTNLTLISPWMPYLVFCVVLGALMTLASILAVRRAR